MDNSSNDSSSTTSNNIDAATNKRKRTESNSSSNDQLFPSWIAGSSPQRFVTFEELMSTAKSLDNMALAHEIAVNADFKLEKPQHSSSSSADASLPVKVHDIVHRAFWDVLEEGLNQKPPNYKHALILLAEIKQNLLALLLPHHTKLKAEIEEHLDLELFEQQCENEVLDFMPIAQYILNIMCKLCAPVRDEALNKLKSYTEIIPLFKGVFEILDLMKLDMANFAIASIRPTLQQQSVEYERSKFDEYLKLNPSGLTCTTNWLNRAADKIFSEQEEENEKAVKFLTTEDAGRASCSSKTIKIDGNAILNEAFWLLLEHWDENVGFPETLIIDETRLKEMKSKCFQLMVVSSIIVVTTNFCGKDLADISAFKNTLKAKCFLLLNDCDSKNLNERLLNVAEQIGVEVDETLEQTGVQMWDRLRKDALKYQIIDLEKSTNPVRKLMKDRIKSFVMSVVGSNSPSPIKVPPGLNIIQSELAQMTGSFLRVISHNRAVFGQHYERILGNISIESSSKTSVVG